MRRSSLPLFLVFATAAAACSSTETVAPAPAPHAGVYALAGGCFTVGTAEPGGDTGWLRATKAGEGFEVASGSAEGVAHFFLKAADLGTYLLYDQDGRYLVVEEAGLERRAELESDLSTLDDAFVSGAEWDVVPVSDDVAPEDEQGMFLLRHRKSARFLSADGTLAADPAGAAPIVFQPAEGCAAYPELTLDAEGTATRTRFDDGTLYGFVDAHSHMMTSFAFGGGGIFHGAPFHRLGVAHALPDCEPFHGVEGRKDLLGFAFDQAVQGGDFDVQRFLPALLVGHLDAFSHYTAGYPDFPTWPAGPFSSTHQTQYYRWLQRAWLGGLRLVVQDATSNSAFCELIAGEGIQPVRYSCSDMVATDRSIQETFALERYIDAQEGGPGKGWFRLVKSPAEARAVIGEGKLAVLLGIEVSNLFDCLLTPRPDSPVCDEAYVVGQLDRYRELGVRAIFPAHKYDNAFSAGDGHRAISEIGNFANSGHWSSYGLDCPTDVSSVFDHGDVFFGGLNHPRDDYDAPAPNDLSEFPEDPLGTLLPFLDQLSEPPLVGDYCQTHGLTPLGETLIREMMKRGMLVEIDHLPRKSYQRAYEILAENAYPAVATHGTEYDGRIYANAGISKSNFGRCADPARPGNMADSFRDRTARIAAAGGYPAPGFGFDLNGFAGAPGPRFGDRSECEVAQSNPVTYPFMSFAGDVTFTQPQVGNRTLDFNTEGMVHVGLIPELIEDARRTGATDADIEPIFRSAEGYLRMWERAEERAAAMR